MKKLLTTAVICIGLAACAGMDRSSDAANASHGMDHGSAAAGGHETPIDLLPDATGSYSWKITTDVEAAQAYFDQGMQLRFAYGVDEAARSMVEARRRDPDCAMCYWGEAFALGSYLNGGMTAANAPHARAAILKANELAGTNASPLERELIAAALSRYPENYQPDNRRPVDQAFADAMAGVYERYPDNHEVATVYAVALFMLEERRGYRDLADPNVIRLHGVLTGVLDQDITHPGACHLYIHATESSQQPQRALPCAELLGNAIPGASHINHMPSHTYNELGMWGKSVSANTQAWHSDLKASVKEGVAIYPPHNLHMLLFSASMDGQGAIATQAGKDYAKVAGNSMYEVLTLLRFGRFDEVLKNDNRPDNGVSAALWDFAHGYASLREGDRKTAAKMRDRVLEFAATTDAKFRFHPAGLVVGTAGHILEGEIFRDQGDLDAAIAAFEQAVSVEDQLDYDEPEPLPFAARHWLGAALLEAGRHTEAEQVYRDELEKHPHNGWSLYGLKQALTAQGKSDATVDADFEQSWARSDTWIQASRF